MKELRFDAADGAGARPLLSTRSAKRLSSSLATRRARVEARSYRTLIATADKRFDAHMAQQKKGE